MEKMSHRERVLTALAHREPDRVPLDLWGSAYSLNDGIYFRTKELLDIQGEIQPWRRGKTSNYYDERLLERLDIDFRHVWLGSRTDWKTPVLPDGSYIDEWGITWKPQADFVSIVQYPLQHATLDEIKKHPWPEAGAPGRTVGLRERARWLRENTDCSIVARSATSFGMFDYCCSLRSTEQFLMDMMLSPEIAHTLIDRVTQFELELNALYLDAVGEYIDILCWAEDFGHQTSMMMSPKLYRQFFKPRHKEIISMVKRKAPHVRFQFHSCGAIRSIIPDFIEAGVDILQGIQPLASAMDSEQLKRDFGDQISFHGGIDIQRALIGSLEEIDREVRQRIAALAPGGGYILAPTNNVQDDTPAENLVHLYRAAATYGRYPLAR